MQGNTLFDKNKYPILYSSTDLLPFNPNPLLGMDDILLNILAGLHKSEMSNILLVAQAGSGKTATVQEFAKRYSEQYVVLQTSIAQLQRKGAQYLATNFKEMFLELERYRKDKNESRQLILFIDELHRLPMQNKAAVEDLKPEFARSAQLGIHIIGATTYDEYLEYIDKNEAFKQRFEVINLPPVDDDLTFKILKSRMRKQKDVKQTPETDKILRQIIFYTDAYIKERAQPRKSTDICDQMLGWVRIGKGYKFNHELLAKVFYFNTHVRIDLQLDAKHLKRYLNSQVFDQPQAIDAIVDDAYSSILGISDPTRPRSSFLFVGSTGVGKTQLAKAFTKAMFGPDAHLNTFDMAEYQTPDMVNVFKDRLTDIVLSANTPVILLDEIEKANKGISTLLFSVLDEARLSNKLGRPVNFSNFFFLFTTNAGSDIFDDIAGQTYSSKNSAKTLEKYNRLIFRHLANERSFPTPLLGRMTGFIPFLPMQKKTNVKIARRTLRKTAQQFMQKTNVKVRYDYENVIRFITEERLDRSAEAGGARQILTLIRRNVTNKISEFLVFHPGVNDVYVSTKGLARTKDVHRLTSTEYIHVEKTSPEIIKEDFEFAIKKFKKPLINLLRSYQSKGLNIRVSAENSKRMFELLARSDMETDTETTLKVMFEPLEMYYQRIIDWHRRFDNHPGLIITESCPSNNIQLEIANNELEIFDR